MNKRKIATVCSLALVLLLFQNCAKQGFQSLSSDASNTGASVEPTTTVPPPTGVADLAWDPNTEPSLMGYKLYYGTAPGNYSQSIDVGNVTSYVVSNLPVGVTYYFVVKAYDAFGESSNSNEISKSL